jgi:hypothetical protein
MHTSCDLPAFLSLRQNERGRARNITHLPKSQRRRPWPTCRARPRLNMRFILHRGRTRCRTILIRSFLNGSSAPDTLLCGKGQRRKRRGHAAEVAAEETRSSELCADPYWHNRYARAQAIWEPEYQRQLRYARNHRGANIGNGAINDAIFQICGNDNRCTENLELMSCVSWPVHSVPFVYGSERVPRAWADDKWESPECVREDPAHKEATDRYIRALKSSRYWRDKWAAATAVGMEEYGFEVCNGEHPCIRNVAAMMGYYANGSRRS